MMTWSKHDANISSTGRAPTRGRLQRSAAAMAASASHGWATLRVGELEWRRRRRACATRGRRDHRTQRCRWQPAVAHQLVRQVPLRW